VEWVYCIRSRLAAILEDCFGAVIDDDEVSCGLYFLLEVSRRGSFSFWDGSNSLCFCCTDGNITGEQVLFASKKDVFLNGSERKYDDYLFFWNVIGDLLWEIWTGEVIDTGLTYSSLSKTGGGSMTGLFCS
jgi:hypothetical protein